MLDLEDGAALPSRSTSPLSKLPAHPGAAERRRARLRAAEIRRAHGVQRDWTVLRAGGPDASTVFETPGGDLERVRVPFFFT